MTKSAAARAAPESGEVELVRVPEESLIAFAYAAIACALPALALLVFGLHRWAAVALALPLLLLMPWLNGRRLARRVAVQVFARALDRQDTRVLGVRLALREEPAGCLQSVEAGLTLAEAWQAVEAGSTTPELHQAVAWASTRRLERQAFEVDARGERVVLGARLELAFPDQAPAPKQRDWQGSRFWCIALVLHGPRAAVTRWRFDLPDGHAWTDFGLPQLP